MNQIGIVFIIISKWLKNIKISVLNLIILTILMLLSIYCYVQYSFILKQSISIENYYDCDDFFNIDSTSLFLNLDVAPIHNKYYLDANQNKIVSQKNKEPYLRFELFSSSSYQDHSEDGVRDYLNIKSNYSTIIADDSWFFPRTPWLFNKKEPDFVTLSPDFFYTENIERVDKNIISNPEPETGNEYYFGKRYQTVSFEGEKNCATFFNRLMEKTDSNRIDSVYFQYSINEGTYKPSILSPYDISQFYYNINICNQIHKSSIIIEFNGIINPLRIFPIPDTITTQSFKYINPDKIKEISKNGIQCYISFPQNVTLQQVKIYVISALITIIFTILCKTFWGLLIIKYRERRRFNNTRNLLIINDHTELYQKFCRHRYFANTCLFFFLFLVIHVIAPKDIAFSRISMFGLIVLIVPSIAYLGSISKGIYYGLSLEKEYLRFINMPIYIFILIGLCNCLLHCYSIKSQGSSIYFSDIETYLIGAVIPIILILINFANKDSIISNLKKRSWKRHIGLIIYISLVFLIIICSPVNISIGFILFSIICIVLFIIYLYRSF